jgi:hypothetical protein
MGDGMVLISKLHNPAPVAWPNAARAAHDSGISTTACTLAEVKRGMTVHCTTCTTWTSRYGFGLVPGDLPERRGMNGYGTPALDLQRNEGHDGDEGRGTILARMTPAERPYL